MAGWLPRHQSFPSRRSARRRADRAPESASDQDNPDDPNDDERGQQSHEDHPAGQHTARWRARHACGAKIAAVWLRGVRGLLFHGVQKSFPKSVAGCPLGRFSLRSLAQAEAHATTI